MSGRSLRCVGGPMDGETYRQKDPNNLAFYVTETPAFRIHGDNLGVTHEYRLEFEPDGEPVWRHQQ